MCCENDDNHNAENYCTSCSTCHDCVEEAETDSKQCLEKLKNQLQKAIDERNEAWCQLEENNIEIRKTMMPESNSGDSESLSDLGSLVMNSLRSAFKNPQPVYKVTKTLLLKLADKQGIHNFAAKTLKEVKRREMSGETVWVTLDDRALLVNGEVVSETYLGDIFTMESFSGPSTEITDSLTDDEIEFLQSSLANK